jgi:hypothetical protein
LPLILVRQLNKYSLLKGGLNEVGKASARSNFARVSRNHRCHCNARGTAEQNVEERIVERLSHGVTVANTVGFADGAVVCFRSK